MAEAAFGYGSRKDKKGDRRTINLEQHARIKTLVITGLAGLSRAASPRIFGARKSQPSIERQHANYGRTQYQHRRIDIDLCLEQN